MVHYELLEIPFCTCHFLKETTANNKVVEVEGNVGGGCQNGSETEIKIHLQNYSVLFLPFSTS